MTLRRLTSAIILLNVGLVATLLAYTASADQRSLEVEGKAPSEFIAGQAGKSWAVVIGIDDYDLLPRLSYAVADAQSIARLLEQQGFQVTELYNKQATRRAILDYLGNKLEERVDAQDRVVVFYAGHGETKKPKGEGKEMGYLMPVNARPGQLADSAISMGLIQELADGLPAKHVLFLVDVCYAGIAGQRFRGLPTKINEDYVKTITRERGRQLITAGGADQEALEGPEWGHSVFTHYLLEGLGKGLADLNDDGIIPASELHLYLDQRVFEAAQMKKHKQRPEMWKLAPEKGEFVFISAKLERMLTEKSKPPETPKPIEEARVRPHMAPAQTSWEITGKDGAKMMLVPAGEFLYGDNNRRMSLSAFYMHKYEVTTSRYAKFLQVTGREEPHKWNEFSQMSDGDRPVIGVNWHDADAYCRNYGKRLPTEEEWEKAARGTDGRKYPWGDAEPSRSFASFDWDGKRTWQGYSTLSPVGSYESGKSPYGIHDLAGNVWEWTSSDFDSSYKVLRGGSWSDTAYSLRSTNQYRITPINRNNHNGFRCAQDVPK